MDDIVLKSLVKWPNVPSCTGWLAFDRRGNWRMRNEYAQTNGLPGDPIRHEALLSFIARNYDVDEVGQWYFQNGPQRVYVELAYTPWVVRLHPAGDELQWRTSSDAPFQPTACWMDEQGNVLLEGNIGKVGEAQMTTPVFNQQIAVLHDGDLQPFTQLAEFYGQSCGAALGCLRWQHQTFDIEPIVQHEVAQRYRYVPSPAQRQSHATPTQQG